MKVTPETRRQHYRPLIYLALYFGIRLMKVTLTTLDL